MFTRKTIFYVFLTSMLGFIAGGLFVYQLILSRSIEAPPDPLVFPNAANTPSYEETIIQVVKEASPSVVSVVVTKDIPVLEKFYYDPFEEFRSLFGDDFGFKVPRYRQKGTEERAVSGGTGFIVSVDGLILTNRHVVQDEEARYSILTNDGESLEAEVLARDPVQDIAILEAETKGKLPVVRLSDSDELQIGQTVIAIGNVLGEFRNSASIGIVSGLKRDVTAVGSGTSQELRNIIQTDAAINQGNSGGPLLNLKGEVVGINTAMAVEAENVGFAIPINRAKRDIQQVRDTGEISYPFLGIYYTATKEGMEIMDVFSDSPAKEVGLQKNDLLIEFGGEEMTLNNTLADVIGDYIPDDTVTLKILRGSEELTFEITLSALPD